MNYKQVLDYILNSLPMFQRIGQGAYKGGLENILLIDKHLGCPHHSFKSIHIAGTNGKGSLSSLLASVLMEEGYTVGLFTSPHFLDYRERIRVNGEKISEAYVCDFVNQHKTFFDRIEPSFFEMSVGLAFSYFKDQKVDVAIVEVGLGGRLDATNILQPLASVITYIGYDHTAILGETLQQIAHEKAGIIKNKIPVVIGRTQDETASVFKDIAKAKETTLTFADQQLELYHVHHKDNMICFDVRNNGLHLFSDIKTTLVADYQQENFKTVFLTLKTVNELLPVSETAVIRGFEKVHLNSGIMGRWQVIQKVPMVIADMAHNIDGITHVMQQINKMVSDKLHIVFGFVGDKPVDAILDILPENAMYYFCKAEGVRGMDAYLLQQIAASKNRQGGVHDNVKNAYKQALQNASANDVILICGSTFVVAEVLG